MDSHQTDSVLSSARIHLQHLGCMKFPDWLHVCSGAWQVVTVPSELEHGVAEKCLSEGTLESRGQQSGSLICAGETYKYL